MNCILSLCDRDNPHGFCGNNSCLFNCCTMPFSVILGIVTLPVWLPVLIIFFIKDECEKCIEWSEQNNKYEKYTKIENANI